METLAAEIRPARPGDAGQIVSLQEDIYADGRWFVGQVAPTTDSIQRRLQYLNPNLSLYLVAERNRQLLGWLELNRLQQQRMRHVALLTIAIGAPWRRQGLGRALLHDSYEWAQKVGVHKITLNVRARNHSAIALYRAEGFTVEGIESNQFVTDDGFEDNIIMARNLT